MRYKPERALTHITPGFPQGVIALVEMRYKPERALTLLIIKDEINEVIHVEMRYKPERALTLLPSSSGSIFTPLS